MLRNKNRIGMQKPATMAKCGMPMPLQTHVEDNQTTRNRFDWHNRPRAPDRQARTWISAAAAGLSFELFLNQMFRLSGLHLYENHYIFV
jgi:hypothetical protein